MGPVWPKEILQMGADDEARALNVKLGEEEEQSFQLFHPESAREIALQAKLMQASDQLDNKRKKDAEEEEEAKRRREQDASDWASINVLTMAPIQEGMQSVPDSEVRSSGVATLRRANLEAVREQLRKTFLDEGRVDTMDALDKAQTDMDTARAKNKELQEAGPTQYPWIPASRIPLWNSRWHSNPDPFETEEASPHLADWPPGPDPRPFLGALDARSSSWPLHGQTG